MSETNTSKIDIAPLTLVVSEALDPRVRRKLEAEQQADVKTYKELTRSLEVQEDLNKIRQEVEKDGEEADPFKAPDATENQPQQADEQAQQPAEAQNPAPDQNANATAQPADGAAAPAAQAPAEGAGEQNQAAATQDPNTGGNDAAGGAAAGGGDEDLSAAFEGFGTQLPSDLLRRVVKDYIKMESSDTDSTGELDHIKSFVYIDLSENAVEGDTLESVQTLRDPENTIVVINEESIPNADTVVRARQIAEQLSNRGVKVFYDLEEATEYLNDLYDIVAGRKKEA